MWSEAWTVWPLQYLSCLLRVSITGRLPRCSHRRILEKSLIQFVSFSTQQSGSRVFGRETLERVIPERVSLNVYRKCCDFVHLCSDWFPVGTFPQTCAEFELAWARARVHGHYLWAITEMCWWECEGNKLSVQPVSCRKLVFTDAGKRKCSDTEHGNIMFDIL